MPDLWPCSLLKVTSEAHPWDSLVAETDVWVGLECPTSSHELDAFWWRDILSHLRSSLSGACHLWSYRFLCFASPWKAYSCFDCAIEVYSLPNTDVNVRVHVSIYYSLIGISFFKKGVWHFWSCEGNVWGWRQRNVKNSRILSTVAQSELSFGVSHSWGWLTLPGDWKQPLTFRAALHFSRVWLCLKSQGSGTSNTGFKAMTPGGTCL